MNIQEAYKILNVSESISDEDLNKTFRRAAAKLHPDVNKEPDAELKSKQLSEAYSFIKNYRENPPPQQFFNPFNNRSGPQDFFNQVRFNLEKEKPSINIPLTLSFKDSILGCKQEVSYEKDIFCEDCEGEGLLIKDKCLVCKGQGFTIKTEKQNNTVFRTKVNCHSCESRGYSTQDCNKCKKLGVISTSVKLMVTIPPGIGSTTMRLINQGHMFKHMFGAAVQHAFLNITVPPDTNMWQEGNDIISNLEISLLEALQGTNKTVKTIDGEQLLAIPPKVKNKEQISLNKLGVDRRGGHNFILNVSYPDDVSKLIQALKPEDIKE